MYSSFTNGSIQIKNVSGESYYIEEIDYALANQDTVDLLDDTLVNYLDYASASRLLNECPNAKLVIDIRLGKLELLVDRPPII